MCFGGPFPPLLAAAGIPTVLESPTTENEATTLAQIFADRPAELRKAIKVLETLRAGRPGTITGNTTIGEIRKAVKRNIIAEATELANAPVSSPQRNMAKEILRRSNSQA